MDTVKSIRNQLRDIQDKTMSLNSQAYSMGRACELAGEAGRGHIDADMITGAGYFLQDLGGKISDLFDMIQKFERDIEKLAETATTETE